VAMLIHSKGTVTLDYPAKRARFYCAQDGPDAARAGYPFEDRALRPLVPTWVNDEGPFWFLIDSGSNRCHVSPRLARALELPCGPPSASRGALGTLEGYHSTLRSLEVGDVEVQDLDVGIFDCSNAEHPDGNPRVDGYVGHDVLSRRRLTLDYGNVRFALTPSIPIGHPQPSRRSGFSTG